jgi:hypothetical protein
MEKCILKENCRFKTKKKEIDAAQLEEFSAIPTTVYFVIVQFLWNSFYRKRLPQQNGDMRKRDLNAFKLYVEQGQLLSPPPPHPLRPTRDKRLAGSVCPAPPLHPRTPHG